MDRCIFQNNALCGEGDNKFHNPNTVRQLSVERSIMIKERHKAVKKVMTFRMVWLHMFYINPIGELLVQREEEQKGQQKKSQPCNIL